MIEVTTASPSDRDAWDAYVAGKAPPYHAHCWGWREIISGAFAHRPHYLVAKRQGSIAGVLPLFEVRSILFGRALISLPYLNGGGILANDGDSKTALLARATELLGEVGGRYLELRHREPLGGGALAMNVEERSHKVSMLLPLDRDPELLMSRFPAKLRSQIRRPARDGVSVRSCSRGRGDCDVDHALRAFYSVFAENMRDLGTPVYPRKLFDLASAQFGAECRVFTAWSGTKAVAAAITIASGGHVEVPWASSLRAYNRLSPNMLLYWEAIRAACEDGNDVFDFGRSSPDSGTYRFKEQWGAAPLPLHWYYVTGRGGIPDVNPRSGRFSRAVNVWRRLPLLVANLAGPWVTRSLP